MMIDKITTYLVKNSLDTSSLNQNLIKISKVFKTLVTKKINMKISVSGELFDSDKIVRVHVMCLDPGNCYFSYSCGTWH